MQWRRLIADKKDVDYEPGFVWCINYKKVAFWMFFAAVILFFIYAFTRPDTVDFLRNCLVYAMIGLIIIAIFTVLYGTGKGLYSKMKGFLIAWVFILVTYVILGWIMSYSFGWNVNYGYGAWVLMLTLAGFHKIDGKLDSRDVFYAMVVVIAIIGANMPFGIDGRSVLDMFTLLIKKIFSILGVLKGYVG